jgi:hypothetical protein
MAGRWRLCSFPRVVIFRRRHLLLLAQLTRTPGGRWKRFLADSLRGGLLPDLSGTLLPFASRRQGVAAPRDSPLSLPARSASVPAFCEPLSSCESILFAFEKLGADRVASWLVSFKVYEEVMETLHVIAA